MILKVFMPTNRKFCSKGGKPARKRRRENRQKDSKIGHNTTNGDSSGIESGDSTAASAQVVGVPYAPSDSEGVTDDSEYAFASTVDSVDAPYEFGASVSPDISF